MRKQLTMGLVSMMVITSSLSGVKAKSSSAKLMDQFVAAYKAGNYAKAKKVCNKMKDVVEEPCAYKMSQPMKKAYRTTVQRYVNRYRNDDEVYVSGYGLSDVDGDGKAELFITTRGYIAGHSTMCDVFQYKKGKAVKIGKDFEFGDASLHAYPGKKGVYFFSGDFGTLVLDKGIIKDGKFKFVEIKGPSDPNSKVYEKFLRYLRLGMFLNMHDGNKRGSVDMKLLK